MQHQALILVTALLAQACASQLSPRTVRDPFDAATVAIASAWVIAHDSVERTCNARLAWMSQEVTAQVKSGQIASQEEAIAYANQLMSTCIVAAKAITEARAALDALLRLHAAGQGRPAYCAALQALKEAQKASDRVAPLPSVFFDAVQLASSFGGCV